MIPNPFEYRFNFRLENKKRKTLQEFIYVTIQKCPRQDFVVTKDA